MRTSFNNGEWTQSRFNSFIKSALRQASTRWPPKNKIKKKARLTRGIYLCSGFKTLPHEVPASIQLEDKKKRTNNVLVDHINPVINPTKGFTTWDEVINRLFCEEDNLQVLCYDYHTRKTQEEKEISKNARS